MNRLPGHPGGSGPPPRHRWRGLEELAAAMDPGADEFAPGASDEPTGSTRREFLQVMAAGAALAGLAGCWTQPREKIVPYIDQPEGVVPGRPKFFATALILQGVGRPVLVESHEGRPTKIEGNPQHPESLGSTDLLAQAEILSMYDPDRSRVAIHLGDDSSWTAFAAEIGPRLEDLRRRGAGLGILTGALVSPTAAAQLQDVLARYPGARWYRHEPALGDGEREAARALFGRELDLHYRLIDADVVVTLDADVLGCGPSMVRLSREFADRRRATTGYGRMNQLYAIECTPTLTGAAADQRLGLRPSRMVPFARALAERLGAGGAGPAGDIPEQRWLDRLAQALSAARGRAVVVPGPHQPAAVHQAAHAINEAVGAFGRTVFATNPVEPRPGRDPLSIADLAADIDHGALDTLFIIDRNPVYDAPAEIGFAERLARVPLRVHYGPYADETAAACHWHLPAAHALESWSDVRAVDGTVTIVQPLVEPLFGGRTVHEVFAVLLGVTGRSAHDLLQEAWRARHAGADFDASWRRALHDGFVRDTAEPFLPVRPTGSATGQDAAVATPQGGLEIVFRPDSKLWDGRHANNAWLQELPEPVSKLSWDNAVLLAPATAKRLDLENGDLVDLTLDHRSVRGPVWVLPGQPDGVVTVHLGWGRLRAGRVGTGRGFNAYTIRSAAAPWSAAGLTLVKAPGSYPLVTTQTHFTMEGRDHVRVATAAEFRRDPQFAARASEVPKRGDTLYPNVDRPGFERREYAWAMAIDLNACTGCSTCVLACQAENNIPTVGKAQVANGREMHWIRVDRYYDGDLENPRTLFQPVPCMHCETAPCELVCPVGATVHSEDGLNQQIYNRCIGTRYCSNNCPYKVRRFNFLQYVDEKTPSLMLMRNPNVSVRTRGVMEKCTYCVQRIEEARIRAMKEDRPIRDGEVVPACAGACPTRAITFGDLNDPASRVSRIKAQPTNYAVLSELNTRPRTTYLARVTNPGEPDDRG